MYRVSIVVKDTMVNHMIFDNALLRICRKIELTPEGHGMMTVSFNYTPRRYKAFFKSNYSSGLDVKVCAEQVKDAIAHRGLSELAKRADQVVAVDEYGYVICEWFNEVNA